MDKLKKIAFTNYPIGENVTIDLEIAYEVFGQPLYSSPIVLVNHALTGNSTVSGEKGWWNDLIGKEKVIDTEQFTVLSFNIPGNGYDGFFLEDHTIFDVEKIAQLFIHALEKLNVANLHAIIGGSIGGAVTWQMAYLKPNLAKYIIPIATHWYANDWIISNAHVQELILTQSKRPLHDARIHAMLLYRTPQSLSAKFKRAENEVNNEFEVINWLEHHGEKLNNRFQLKSYRLMNHLLKGIQVTDKVENLAKIQSEIHMVGIDSDYLFIAQDSLDTLRKLKPLKENVYYHEIKSIHGHDAFLIEHVQLEKILSNLFLI